MAEPVDQPQPPVHITPAGPSGSTAGPTHVFVTGGIPVNPDETPANDPRVALEPQPATIESTWRLFATALGVSAANDSVRAARAIRRIPGTAR